MKNKYYYKDGTTSSEYDVSKELHRTDGPAAEYANGDSSWYVDDKRHRVDGPAIEYADGGKVWYVDGKRHRIDGPAYEHVDGMKLWYVDSEHYVEIDFNKLIKEVKQLPLALKLTDPREWVRNYEK